MLRGVCNEKVFKRIKSYQAKGLVDLKSAFAFKTLEDDLIPDSAPDIIKEAAHNGTTLTIEGEQLYELINDVYHRVSKSLGIENPAYIWGSVLAPKFIDLLNTEFKYNFGLCEVRQRVRIENLNFDFTYKEKYILNSKYIFNKYILKNVQKEVEQYDKRYGEESLKKIYLSPENIRLNAKICMASYEKKEKEFKEEYEEKSSQHKKDMKIMLTLVDSINIISAFSVQPIEDGKDKDLLNCEKELLQIEQSTLHS